jgi:SOS-response transcriptional repressors (RecA-mediated autopeptidases)
MTDMHETARRLYRAALDIKGLSRPSDVAKAMGESPQTLKNWESRGVSYKGRMTAMTTIGINPAFIEHGEGQMEAQGFLPRLSAGLPNVTELDPQRIRVPLISWIQAGEFSDVVDLFHPGEAVQWEDALKSKPGRSSYALMVEGDSMVSTTSTHSFPPGTVLIVDPERGANAGDYVIAKDVQTQRATFKQLTTDGSRWYLKPLNAQYPTIEIDDPSLRVIGRVIEAKPPSVKL